MLKMVCKLLVFVLLCFTLSRGTDITFKNVTIVYSWHGELPEKRIPSSNSLKDFLPVGLEKIFMKGQRIPVLYEDSLADLVNLDELAIEYSQVEEIRPGALKNVQLKTFSLRGNSLEKIREGVFNNLEISTLDLLRNKINSIEDGAFDNMTQLQLINLGFNKIAAWNKNWFQNTPNLYDIWMHNNFLEEIPQEAFKNWKQKYFQRYGLNLILDHNKIKFIHPDAFKGVGKICRLDLRDNQLQNFDGHFLNNVKVDILNLGNNNIVCLQGDYKIIFQAITSDIDNNPFDCECFKKMKIWLNENKKLVHYLYVERKCTIKASTLK